MLNKGLLLLVVLKINQVDKTIIVYKWILDSILYYYNYTEEQLMVDT